MPRRNENPRDVSRTLWPLITILILAMVLAGCFVKGRCKRNEDCEGAQICKDNQCAFECNRDSDCGVAKECREHRCWYKPKPIPIDCPDDMVPVANSFCIDIYEASRPDASTASYGVDESRATSREGVMPWRVASNAAALSACQAAGKRLCTPMEWEQACRGPTDRVYAYGNEYEPATCNGIDAFGLQFFHPTPTGSFPGCTNGYGVYDMNGNFWEHTAEGSDKTVRGGAYNCSDSRTLHRCDYNPQVWAPSARGFRCCKDAG